MLKHYEEWTKFFRNLKNAINKKEVPNKDDKFGNYLIAHDSKKTFFILIRSKTNSTLKVSDLCDFVGEETGQMVLEVFSGIFGKKVSESSQYLDKIDYILQILESKKNNILM